MPEKVISRPETAEHLLQAHEHELLPAHAETPQTAEQDPSQAAAEARQAIAHTEKIPNPLERLEASEQAAAAPVQHTVINRQLKQITLRRELKQLQRKENLSERTLSRVIHQPIVRTVSEAAGKTVSRPSGLLGGSLVAFVGTTGYLYFSKHFGYRYNYLVFLLLLAAGFVLGLILELLVYLATNKHRSQD